MRGILEKYGTAIAGLVLVGFFAIAAPNFAAPNTLLNIAKETSFLAIIAIGFTLALVTAELDLSVADVASLAAVVARGRGGTPARGGEGSGAGLGVRRR
ncbi:hypothetical protein G6F62_015773 [Rhizopus arrhizus]|nr:hypothetical protein G6F62_015773 [Rhizopus arrhizus]